MEYQPLPDLKEPPGGSLPPSRTIPLHPHDPPPDRRARRRRFILWVGLPVATVVLAIATGVGVAASIQRPEVERELADFVPRLVTSLYDRSGQPYRTYQRENRVLLEEGDVPELLQNAIIAAEDSEFFRHGGIDVPGIVRALIANYRAGRKVQGASTITMQLARELFLTREKSWKRKIEEAFLAVELEKQFSKQQLLTLYCNLVNLGHGNYGMEAAARDYFNKSVGDLSLVEAATLAGIPQRPTDLSPYRNPERVTQRRNHVLGRMAEERFITKDELAQATAEPLLVTARHREVEIGPYFSEEVRRFLAEKYGTNALYDQGLQVSTTLDRDIQRAADLALRKGLLELDHVKGWRGPTLHFEEKDLESQKLPSWTDAELVPGAWAEGIVVDCSRERAVVKIGRQSFELRPKGIEWTRRRYPIEILKRGDVAWFRLEIDEKSGAPELFLEQEPALEAAALVLESATGAVRAMVGGWSYDRNEFNRITQAHRQVGSAFKPFVYGVALENGFTAADTLFDGPAIFLGADGLPSYSPRNYKRRYNGILTLRGALEQSINVPAVKLLDMVGVERVIDFARRCGVHAELPPYPSLALGSADITPLEMAAAYASFVNQGIWVEPYWIEKITSQDGRLLEQHLPRAHKAMEPQIAYVLTRMLKGVVDRGTAASPPRFELDLGGKTGTTNDYTDAWFVGFTPRYTILSWVGYDQKRTLGAKMTGARAALPIWKSIVEQGLTDGWLEKGETFARPTGIVEVAIEAGSGLRATPEAEKVIAEAFLEGTEPEQKFTPRWARILQLPWFQQEAFYLPKEGERMPGQVDDWDVVREAWEGGEDGDG